jgi:uncharacterized membrane protein
LKQKETFPGDLLVCVTIALAALLLTIGTVEAVFWNGAYVALALVFFLPGYALSIAFFPGQNDLERTSRAALILLLSATSVLLLGLFLKFIDHLDAGSLSQMLALLAAAAIAGAHLRRSSLPKSRRFSPGKRQNLRSTWKVQPAKIPARTRIILPLILVALVLIAAAVGLSHFMSPQSENGFTEFVVDGEEKGGDSLQATVGQARESLVRIVNHEGRTVDYSLLLLANGRKLRSDELELEEGGLWDQSVSYTLQEPGKSQVLDFLLYKDDNSTAPYLSRQLTFNVVDQENATEKINASNETEPSQASLAEDTAINSTSPPVVLSSTFSSSSSGSTSRSTKKSAETGSAESSADESNESQVQESEQGAEEEASNLSAMDNQSLAEASEVALEENQTEAYDREIMSEKAMAAPSIPEILPLQKIEELEASLNFSHEIEAQHSEEEKASETAVSEDRQSTDSADVPSDLEEEPAGQLSKPENESHALKTPESSTTDENTSIQVQFPQFPENESSANQTPQIIDLNSDKPSPQQQGITVIWTVKADDPEDDVLSYKFYLDNKAVTSWTRSNTWNWFSTGSSAGEHQISVWVRDGKHADKKSFDSLMNRTFVLLFPNQTPVLIDLAPDRASPQPAGTSITWKADAKDPDGDRILYRFFLNGQAVTDWQQSGIWVWPTAGESSGDYQVKVWVRDGIHATADRFDASREVPFSLADTNLAPSLNSFSPDRSDPQPPGAHVTWTAGASDPEGDLILYRFLVNGKAATDWSGSSSWAWNTADMPEGDYRIRVEVRDGQHADEDMADSSMDFTFALESSNRKPVITTLKSDKSSPQAQGSEVTWTAETFDEDGDPVLLQFSLNGRPQTTWSNSPTWTWITEYTTEGTYRIGVSARDGIHAGSDGYDDYRETAFVLRSKIDQQIDELMSKRGDEKADYQSTDITLSGDNNSTVHAVLGKSRDDSSQNTGVRETYKVGN